MKKQTFLLSIMLAASAALPVASMAATTAQAVPATKAVVQTKVNLNTADVKQLTSIKGIGLKRAQAILDYRKEHGKFASAAELAHVKGIGENFYKKIESQVAVN